MYTVSPRSKHRHDYIGDQMDATEEGEMTEDCFVKLEMPDPTTEADKSSRTPEEGASSLAVHILRMVKPGWLNEEDLMAIPPPDENKQKTFVGVLSSETAEKLKAMFRRDFCPEIVPLIRGPEICCLPKNTGRMYLSSSKVFTKLIEDAGSLQAMVLIIIFGEKKTHKETLHDEKVYGNVLRQGHELYMKGQSQKSPLDNPFHENPDTTENIALVTVENRPSKFQLMFMKQFVKRAFNDTRGSNESVDHQR